MIKKSIQIISLIFIILNLQGCLSSKKVVKTVLPNWYLNAPQNNMNFLYGTGEAYTLEEAKTNALNNMSQKLVVSVQSSMNTITTTSSQSYDKKMIRDIKLEAKKITFTNYKVKKAINSGNSFFVLLSVNRDELFNQKMKEFKLLDTKINLKVTSINHKTKLEQIYGLEQLKPTISSAKNLAFIAYSINNDFDYQNYIVKYDKYMNNINQLKSEIIIKIQTNTKHNIFKNQLKSFLNKNNYKVSSNNADVLIKISNKSRYSRARGWQIVKTSTNIDVLANDKSISTNTIYSVGRSTSNKENAIDSCGFNFKTKVNDIGLNKILFNK